MRGTPDSPTLRKLNRWDVVRYNDLSKIKSEDRSPSISDFACDGLAVMYRFSHWSVKMTCSFAADKRCRKNVERETSSSNFTLLDDYVS